MTNITHISITGSPIYPETGGRPCSGGEGAVRRGVSYFFLIIIKDKDTNRHIDKYFTFVTSNRTRLDYQTNRLRNEQILHLFSLITSFYLS